MKVGLHTYTRFFSASTKNYVLFPLTILLFLASELVLAMYYRFLSDYDNIAANNSHYFDSITFNTFWIILTLLIINYSIILALKYYLINLCIVNSST